MFVILIPGFLIPIHAVLAGLGYNESVLGIIGIPVVEGVYLVRLIGYAVHLSAHQVVLVHHPLEAVAVHVHDVGNPYRATAIILQKGVYIPFDIVGIESPLVVLGRVRALGVGGVSNPVAQIPLYNRIIG